MTKIEIEGLVELHVEDGGMALIAEDLYHKPGEPDGMFVRLQSWDELKKHPTLRGMEGKTVRVTIEVLDPVAPDPGTSVDGVKRMHEVFATGGISIKHLVKNDRAD